MKRWVAFFVIMCVLCAINGGYIGLLPSLAVMLITSIIFGEKKEDKDYVNRQLSEKAPVENNKIKIESNEDSSTLKDEINEEQKQEETSDDENSNIKNKLTDLSVEPIIDDNISNDENSQNIENKINQNAENKLYCINCGEKLIEGTKFCRKCGTKI